METFKINNSNDQFPIHKCICDSVTEVYSSTTSWALCLKKDFTKSFNNLAWILPFLIKHDRLKKGNI